MAVAHHWQPERTVVFAVGLLQYADRAHWPLAGRRDDVFVESLAARGVPRDRIVFLRDADATCEGFESGLQNLLGRAGPGDQLILYYAGHGARDQNHGRGAFKLRDARLPVSALFSAIERNFPGELAILTADCCYSGSLALEAPLRAGRVAYAALGSSLSTETSTGAWTFTNCWIDALQGKVPVDIDGDGILRLDELARHAEHRLCFLDGQVCSFAVAGGFPSTFVLGPATRRTHARQGELIEARVDGSWQRAEILGERGPMVVVLLVTGRREVAVPPEELRPWRPPELSIGVQVAVRSSKRTWPGTVLAVRNGMHLVRYDGWNEAWDEWVSPDRIEDLLDRPPV